MPIDSSIYFQNKGIDFGKVLDSYNEGVKMSDLAKQKKQEQDKRDAYKSGFKTDANGNTVFDQNVAMSELANRGFGDSAYALQSEIEKRNQTQAQQGIENQQKDRHYKIMEQQNKIDNWFKQASLDAQNKKLLMDQDEKINDGQKTVDKEFAKDYNDWTSGGSSRAKNEIATLKSVAKRLDEGKGTTGGLTGMFGDRFTSDDVLANRAAAKKSAMSLIKTFLSGATSDSDRQEMVNTLWNEADSTENNLGRINSFIADMESRAAETDNKANYYQGNKSSLKGFKQDFKPLAKDENIVKPTPTIEKPDANTRIIDGVLHRKVQGGWLPASK